MQALQMQKQQEGTVVGGDFLKVAVALRGLSLVEERQNEVQLVMLQPLLERHVQLLQAQDLS